MFNLIDTLFVSASRVAHTLSWHSVYIFDYLFASCTNKTGYETTLQAQLYYKEQTEDTFKSQPRWAFL